MKEDMGHNGHPPLNFARAVNAGPYAQVTVGDEVGNFLLRVRITREAAVRLQADLTKWLALDE